MPKQDTKPVPLWRVEQLVVVDCCGQAKPARANARDANNPI
jgi:hypothetical protein